MRTYKKQKFGKNKKSKKIKCGGKFSSKKHNNNKEVELETYKRSGHGIKQMNKDKFVRAAKKASNIRFLRTQARDAHDRQREKEREDNYKYLVHQGRL